MKKKLFSLVLFSLILCGCSEKPNFNNQNNNHDNIVDRDDVIPIFAEEYDYEKNIMWTSHTNIGYLISSFLIENTATNLGEYLGIPSQSNSNGVISNSKSIRSEDEYNEFKNKMENLANEGKILEKYSYEYPIVDFSSYMIELTALYKNRCRCDYSLESMFKYVNGGKIEQRIVGNISNDNLIGDVGLGLCYVILPNDGYKINTVIKYVDNTSDDDYVVKKPIVYFYPEKEMDLKVRFINEERLITTYPKYNGGWNIHLNQDGTFTTNDSDREYYALYFDEIPNYTCDFKEGFYVTKDNAISFLEEKMDYIGFNNHEVNEFIMYWLPVLENNEKSLVYFEQTEERNIESPLEFSTNPDTLIRTIIHIKKVNEKIDILEQQLVHNARNGFVVTEWGGVEY